MNSRIRLVTALVGATGLTLVSSLWTPVSAQTATANLAVSATVANKCTISTTPLAFGAYDPIVDNASTALAGTGGVVITCNKNTATTIGLGLGSNATGSIRRMVLGADYLTYELYQEVGHTTIWGTTGTGLLTPPVAPNKNARTFTVYGLVAPGQDVAAGTFTDTVVATVTY